MGESIVVLGGGVIGLSCAFELQRRGFQVTVLEIKSCGGQASGAAAGMLAPYSENLEAPDSFFQLSLESLRLFPEWQENVKRVSGHTFEYAKSGSVYIAYHEADMLALEGRLLWQRQFGSSGSIVEGEALFQLEPKLSRQVRAALYTPEETHLYAPHYVIALEQACRSIGVIIHEHLDKVTVVEWQNGILLQATGQRKFSGDRLVVCSGAWAQELAETFGIQIPVYPIRGQICAYEMEEKPVQHMVFSNQGYLVAKENSTLVCGASEDVAGFDISITDKGIERLRKWNKQAFPFLEHKEPFHRWAGLRPSTQDGLPLLGAIGGSSQVILAVGHYRNGILLSPATARLTADYIEGKPISGFNQAFLPDRFGTIGER